MIEPPEWAVQGAAWLRTLTPAGAPTRDTEQQPRVFDFAGMTPESAARRFERIKNVQRMMDTARRSPAQVDFIDGPLSGPGGGDPAAEKKAAEERKRAESQQQPPVGTPTPSQTEPTPLYPPYTSPQPTPTTPAPRSAVPPTVPATDPPTAPTPQLPISGTPAGNVPISSINAGLLGLSEPVPGQRLSSPGLTPEIEFPLGGALAPGQTRRLSGEVTVTAGYDETTIVSSTDPHTRITRTQVTNRQGTVISTSESTEVPETGGLSRDTTITDHNGTSRVRSVDDGNGNITTWTANPDGSHSVRYPDGRVIVEPAPGSLTPAQIIQLGDDGLRGRVTAFNPDGTITRSVFDPGPRGAPLTGS